MKNNNKKKTNQGKINMGWKIASDGRVRKNIQERQRERERMEKAINI